MSYLSVVILLLLKAYLLHSSNYSFIFHNNEWPLIDEQSMPSFVFKIDFINPVFCSFQIYYCVSVLIFAVIL